MEIETSINSKWLKENFTENLKFIGKGRTSKVFEFTDPKENKKKIVKVIEKKAGDESQKWSQTTKELIDRLVELNPCKTVIPVGAYNIDEENQRAYLVMEHFERSLHGALSGNRTIDKHLIDNLIRTSLESLSFAHRRKISHGSLSPKNFFFNGNGNVFIDWGISQKYIETESTSETINDLKTETVYTSPEVGSSDKYEEENSFKADIYCLGLIIFACLGIEEKRIANCQKLKKSEDHLLEIESYIDDCVSKTYPEIAPLLRKMCRFNPSDRFDAFQALTSYMELRSNNPSHKKHPAAVERHETGLFQRIFKCCLSTNSTNAPADPKRSRMASYLEAEPELNDNILQRDIPKNKLDQFEKIDRYLETTWKFEKKDLHAVDVNLRGLKKVDDDAVHHIAQLMRNTPMLQTFMIKLWGTKATDKGVASVLVAMKKLKILKHLLFMMGGTHISDKSLTRLGFIMKDQVNLTYLALEFTATKISDAGISELGKSLANLTRITHLSIDFEFTSMGDHGLENITEAIKNYKRLTHLLLKIQVTKTTDVGAMHIGSMLKEIKELVRFELYLGETKITNKGLDSISESLNEFKDMKYLSIDLRNTKVNKLSVQKLVDAVKKYPSLPIVTKEQLSEQDRVPVEVEGVFRFLLKPNGIFLDISGTKCSLTDRSSFESQLGHIPFSKVQLQVESIGAGF